MRDESKTKQQLIDELNALRKEVSSSGSTESEDGRLTHSDRMAAGLAHNFNNVLTAVLGYSHLGLKVQPRDFDRIGLTS